MPLIKKIKEAVSAGARRALDLIADSSLAQALVTDPDAPAAEGERFECPELDRLIRRAGAEGCVLLKNDGALPLESGASVAVLGRCQYDWFYVGYGSGGDVCAPYFMDLMDGLKNAGVSVYEPLAREYRELCSSEKYRAERGSWGRWPFSHPEPPVSSETVRAAAALCRTALVVIGRASGEERDLTPEKGSWFLTDAERALLDTAAESFERVVVVLNIGSLIDLSWFEEYGDRLSAVLIAWLGGQESGNSVCDVLSGRVDPCGRLPMTAARKLSDWPSDANFAAGDRIAYAEGVFMGYRGFDKYSPEAVLFPFAHGLSYTSFAAEGEGLRRCGGETSLRLTVRNTGSLPGKYSAPLMAWLPEGPEDKPLRVLCAFSKTRELAPGGEQTLELRFSDKALARFDEERHAFLLDPGEYAFSVDGFGVGSLTVPAEETVETCEPICIPSPALRARIEAGLPKELAESGKACVFEDIIKGNASPEEFVSGLDEDCLEALTRGHGMMDSPLGPGGNAGVFGGVTEKLRALGVPAAVCCDGPAGLRMKRYCALIPCGTALASTFDTELVFELHRLLGLEMAHFGVDVRLSPGMNLLRHPLCGRNFEYFSEDPTLSGLIAAAEVRGLKASGKAACPKHFACNNRERGRRDSDSAVSERALRELYLRNFELCVKEGRPMTLMTSYNKVNGVWAHYNYDLVNRVLRGEWGFDGAVMTDWWMRRARSPEFPLIKDNAYRVRAGVDLLMPGDSLKHAREYRSDGTLLPSLGRPGGITKAELQASALRVVKVLVKLKRSASAGKPAQ